MNAFEITGGKRLKGEIVPQGAKNEALQIVSAVLLTDQPVTIHNIPDIRDVNKLIELVGDLGCKVEKLSASSYRFTAATVKLYVERLYKSERSTLIEQSIDFIVLLILLCLNLRLSIRVSL